MKRDIGKELLEGIQAIKQGQGKIIEIEVPDDVKMILVDPKMVELKVYNGIEHLLTEVITNPKKASLALRWLVNEMERRYQIMDELNSRDISRYNIKAEKIEGQEKLPYIVLIVDELADLMMVAAKDVEESIARLAQKARAIGIHLILATHNCNIQRVGSPASKPSY